MAGGGATLGGISTGRALRALVADVAGVPVAVVSIAALNCGDESNAVAVTEGEPVNADYAATSGARALLQSDARHLLPLSHARSLLQSNPRALAASGLTCFVLVTHVPAMASILAPSALLGQSVVAGLGLTALSTGVEGVVARVALLAGICPLPGAPPPPPLLLAAAMNVSAMWANAAAAASEGVSGGSAGCPLREPAAPATLPATGSRSAAANAAGVVVPSPSPTATVSTAPSWLVPVAAAGAALACAFAVVAACCMAYRRRRRSGKGPTASGSSHGAVHKNAFAESAFAESAVATASPLAAAAAFAVRVQRDSSSASLASCDGGAGESVRAGGTVDAARAGAVNDADPLPPHVRPAFLAAPSMRRGVAPMRVDVRALAGVQGAERVGRSASLAPGVAKRTTGGQDLGSSNDSDSDPLGDGNGGHGESSGRGAAAGSSGSVAIPAGWRLKRSQSTGRTYYKSVSGEVRWDLPGGVASRGASAADTLSHRRSGDDTRVRQTTRDVSPTQRGAAGSAREHRGTAATSSANATHGAGFAVLNPMLKSEAAAAALRSVSSPGVPRREASAALLVAQPRTAAAVREGADASNPFLRSKSAAPRAPEVSTSFAVVNPLRGEVGRAATGSGDPRGSDARGGDARGGDAFKSSRALGVAKGGVYIARGADDASPWVETVSKSSGRRFFKHRVTGEARWTAPLVCVNSNGRHT